MGYEEPTMVIGIDISHGLGQDSPSVIAASVALDIGCMQMAQTIKVQNKADFICKPVMKDLIKNLANQFVAHVGMKPTRMLVYRDSVSEGQFSKIIEEEVASMREALAEMNGDVSCSNNCERKGCTFCTPLITYVVCQSQHSIRIVPKLPPRNPRDKNVPSGTVVDETIMDYKDGAMATEMVVKEGPREATITLFEDVSGLGYDFLLTAQGGLKGTSKPIFYRTILNENAVWRASSRCSPLTKEKLQMCTYHQSYQYGTATKSVRCIPVIYYSKRLAGMGNGYVSYLRARNAKTPSRWEGRDNCPLKRTDLDDEDKVTGEGITDADSERFTFVRRDAENNTTLFRTELLPSFSPYDAHIGDVIRSPNRPHIAA